jgi:hypothetical protein
MATRLSTALEQWWQQWRPGHQEDGELWNVTVNELVVGDYLVGSRQRVAALGTTGTNRSVTLERLGVTSPAVSWVGASTLWVLR